MNKIHIKKGYDFRVAGSPDREIITAPPPKSIAIQPPEFHGVKPKLLVKEGESVKRGSTLFFDKHKPELMFVSPVSGKVLSIQYGERRMLTSIVIEPDGNNDYIDFGAKTVEKVQAMTLEEAVSFLQNAGAFIYFLQRPFDKIPVADRAPKSIFINGMNTEPNALDQGFVLKHKCSELQLGIEILKKLTAGDIHLCYAPSGEIEVFEQLEDVKKHVFSGPHPAGLVGTHIHYIDPINKDDVIWHIKATHLASIGHLLKTGQVCSEKFVAVSGSGVKTKKYFKTIPGSDVESLLVDGLEDGEQRIISGTVLNGTKISKSGHILFNENNLQVIPEDRKQCFLRWLRPGRDISQDVNTNPNGSLRPIVLTGHYDRYTPLDIYTNFLVKAILAEDLEEALALGLLEVAEEDFSLATFACPSKIDIASIIGQGLSLIEQEGY